jgi:hypothetical protein
MIHSKLLSVFPFIGPGNLDSNSESPCILGDDINTVEKHTEALTDSSQEVGLEVNREN